MRFDDSFLADIRDRVPISAVVGARVTFDRKKTNRQRGDFWGCCPFHGEKSPSFHCEDRKGRFFCFGCGAAGDHFKFLMELDGVTFPRAVEIVADLAGMSLPKSELTPEEKAEYARREAERKARDVKRQAEDDREKARRVNSAGAIWKDTVPLPGTPAAVYLEYRGLPVPDQPTVLRCHRGLPYPKEFGDAPGLHPCLIAKVAGVDGLGVGVWRIFLQPDGRGKLAGVDKPKLGMGPVAGGAVRLGGMAKHIGLGEGCETCLAVSALGATMPVWAALSTSGAIGFIIPPGVERVTFFPDRDYEKIRTGDDGKIKYPPGLIAYRKFKENNPAADIRLAPGPGRLDYLGALQQLKGVPIR